MNARMIILPLLCALTVTHYTRPFNMSFFYRAASQPTRTQLENNQLMTLKAQLKQGRAYDARNRKGGYTPLYSLFSPNKNTSMSGTFDFYQAEFYFAHNITASTFLEYTIPVNRFKFKPYSHKEHIKCCPAYMCTTYGTQQPFITPISTSNLGDSTTLVGWTINNDKTEELDFVDCTLKTGIWWPTGTYLNSRSCCIIPNGYGHWGIPLSCDVAWGAYDWLTLGVHGDTTFFMRSHTHIPSDNCTYETRPGNVSNATIYAEADHFLFDISVLIGYTHSKQSPSLFKPICGDTTSCYTTQSNNPLFSPWSMHTIHIGLNYDMSEEDRLFNPHIEIYFDRVLTGKRIFNTGTIAGTCGINLQWNYA
jgi:hypothetical protein